MVSKRNTRQIVAVIIAGLIILLTIITLFVNQGAVDLADLSPSSKSSPLKDISRSWFSSSNGAKFNEPAEPIMGAMKNETAKAELGRSAWRLLHTMAGKFPNKPTKGQQNAMNDFIYLFAQLYPCGDCARHFKIILESNPPDVTSKQTIADWACRVHNIVNKRKEKPQFDCSKILEFYDCGCGPEEEG